MNVFIRSATALVAAASISGALAPVASAQHVPSTVEIQRFSGGWHYSGNGVLISDPDSSTSTRYVLTTASLVDTASPPDLRVVAGGCDRTNPVGTQTAGVSSYVMGVPTGTATYPNDIAVITLATPIVYDTNTQPARLATDPNNSFAGETSFVAGWWAGTPCTSVISPTCLKITMPVITTAQAQTLMAPVPGASIWDNHLCLFDPAETVAPFKGDLGAGVYVTDSCSGGLVLAGLVSWQVGSTCILPAYPTVCTRISSYVEWISIQTGMSLPTPGTAGTTVSSTTCGCTSMLLSSSGHVPTIPNANFELRVTGAPAFLGGSPIALLYLGLGSITPITYLPGYGNWFYVPATYAFVLNGVSGTPVVGSTCNHEVFWTLPIPGSICFAAGTTLTAQAAVLCPGGGALTNAWQFTLE